MSKKSLSKTKNWIVLLITFVSCNDPSSSGETGGAGGTAGNSNGEAGKIIGNEDLPDCPYDRKGSLPLSLGCPGQCTTNNPCSIDKVCCPYWCTRKTVVINIELHDMGANSSQDPICQAPSDCAPKGAYDPKIEISRDICPY